MKPKMWPKVGSRKLSCNISSLEVQDEAQDRVRKPFLVKSLAYRVQDEAQDRVKKAFLVKSLA